MMPRARPSGSRRDPEGVIAPIYQMRMSEFYHQVHRELPPTRVWGFNGSVPDRRLKSAAGRRYWWIGSTRCHHNIFLRSITRFMVREKYIPRCER